MRWILTPCVSSNAALLGQGLVIFPTWLIAEELAEGALVPLLETWRSEVMPGHRELYVLTPERRIRTLKVRAFMDYLFEAVSPLPPWDRWRERLQR
ncbi:LysR substrate-binding domain-containing protein [Marinobacter sp.]|uniref:LysR substrate-binding domain-containing protein n=1 Tax=Marinobacter sp. TaxID=50741 RepID=UPI0034A3C24C